MKTHNRVLFSLAWLEKVSTLFIVFGVVGITLFDFSVSNWFSAIINFVSLLLVALFSNKVQRDLVVAETTTLDSLIPYYRQRLGTALVTVFVLGASGSLLLFFKGSPLLLLAVYPAVINLIYAWHFAHMRTRT